MIVMKKLLALVLLALAGASQAQTWPTRPVKLIVPFAAGGTTSILARALADKLVPLLGQPVVVDNRPGAGGNVGMDAVAKSEPDGYTLLMGPIGLAINPALYTKMSFDPVKDLAPIGLYAGVPNILVVHPSVPAQSLKELIALFKAHPGKYNYASNGNGTSSHLAAEMLKSSAGVDIVHIPYKGGAPAMADLLAGQVTMLFDQMPAVMPQVKAGKVRALGVSSAQRSAAAPDVPSLAEAGLPGFDMTVWFGLLAPARTPPAVLQRVNAEMGKVLQDAEFRTFLAGLGVTPLGGSPEAFASFIQAETQRWAQVVKASGARID
jgi:tripartite-type tricarboxylate transporter receptor subunit TctC